jgi:anthranilate phosphoribosyltransferase
MHALKLAVSRARCMLAAALLCLVTWKVRAQRARLEVHVQKLGVTKALVVHSMGLDELTPMGPADVVDVTPSGITTYTLDPKDVGIPRCEAADLAGGDAPTNAQILLDVFGGARGAVADALVLNAGYALAACEVAASALEGIAMAQEAQRSGAAAGTLRAWVTASQAAYAEEATTL